MPELIMVSGTIVNIVFTIIAVLSEGEVMLEAVCLLILAIWLVIIVAVNVSEGELRESIRKSME